jgi:hypothetical protein
MKTNRGFLFYGSVFVLMTIAAMNAAAGGNAEAVSEGQTITEGDYEFDAEGITTFNDGSEKNVPGTITKYVGWDTDVVIPATIGDKPVVAIGSSAFNGAELTSVTIPEGVVTIGISAFRNNKLTAVTIPSTVKTIRGTAFADNLLTEAVIPEGVVDIRSNIFQNNQLTKLTIPGTLRTITASAFTNLSLTEVDIPEGVVEIGENAFANNKLTEVVIPESVVVIGNSAFSGNSLDSITIPGSVRSLGSHSGGWWVVIGGDPATFILGDNIGGNSSMVRASLGRNVFFNYIANGRKAGTYTKDMPCEEKTSGDFTYQETQYGAVLTGWSGGGNRLRIPAEVDGVPVKALASSRDIFERFEGMFKGRGLENILIPEGITYIGEETFGNLGSYRNNLTQITIPNTVTYIGDGAFRGNSLTSLTIPGGVEYIGREAFAENQLTSITIEANVPLGTGGDGAPSFGNRFGNFYDGNDKKAGTYTYSNGQWAYRQ